MNKTNDIKYNAVKHDINVKHSDESTQQVGKKSSKASFCIFSFSYEVYVSFKRHKHLSFDTETIFAI